jgi:dipeptidyl aminopeptidase/acylaminoacyl peptidase
MRPARALLSILATLAVAACALPADHAVVPMPPALHAQGVPPVPTSLARKVGRYTELRGARLIDWAPDGEGLLVRWRGGDQVQLHLARPGQPLQLVSPANEPTRRGLLLPSDPDLLLLARDTGGSEAAQVIRRRLSTGEEIRLTDEAMRHELGPLAHDGRHVAITSVPLDRTAAGGRRAQIVTRLSLLDGVAGIVAPLAELPGPGWSVSAFGPDDRRLLLTRYRAASDAEVWVFDRADGQRLQLLPRSGEPAAAWFGVDFDADGQRVWVVSDALGEYRRTLRLDPRDGSLQRLPDGPPGDDEDARLSPDGRRLALHRNVDGRGTLLLYDTTTLRPLPVPELEGSLRDLAFSPDGRRLAVAHAGAASPGTVSVMLLPDGRWQPRVPPDTAGLDPAGFQPTEVVHWTSFDGLRISGLLTRPPARFAGRRPVLIDIHGGPASQAQLGFNGRYNYLINELGMALVEPNVRGSRGFGKSFLALDDGVRREDAVRDIGALLDWIARQPDLDASRVIVSGGSYGGYMSAAVAAAYGERLRGAIVIVGISHFVSFLEHTESYRRDLRRAEYGDERDPAMRAFLHRISPLTRAESIRVPMFVIHGRNDPRVPVGEAEQLVARLQRQGTPVWSLIADDEGHGFAKKPNADYAFYARVMFMTRLLDDGLAAR